MSASTAQVTELWRDWRGKRKSLLWNISPSRSICEWVRARRVPLRELNKSLNVMSSEVSIVRVGCGLMGRCTEHHLCVSVCFLVWHVLTEFDIYNNIIRTLRTICISFSSSGVIMNEHMLPFKRAFHQEAGARLCVWTLHYGSGKALWSLRKYPSIMSWRFSCIRLGDSCSVLQRCPD